MATAINLVHLLHKAGNFYNHPFIYSLFPGSYQQDRLTTGDWRSGAPGQTIMPRAARSNLPTYIPSQNFAATLVDLIRLEAGPNAPLTFATLQEGAEKIQNERLRTAVLAAIHNADGNVDRLRKTFENWYDGTMDRVSGWYKRRTQVILLMLGLAVAVVFNIDAVGVARQLANSKTYREAVVAQIERVRQAQGLGLGQAGVDRAAEPAATPGDTGRPEADPAAGRSQAELLRAPPTAAGPAGSGPELEQAVRRAKEIQAELTASGFVLGWPAPQLSDEALANSNAFLAFLFMVLGWGITGLAVSFGAPFWFDVLNKFMVVRSTVKPAEKSGQEASKDSGGLPDLTAGKLVPVALFAPPPLPATEPEAAAARKT